MRMAQTDADGGTSSNIGLASSICARQWGPGKLAGVEPGLYESLITQGLWRTLDTIAESDRETPRVDDAEEPHVLARHVAEVVELALRSTKGSEDRLALVNRVVDALDLQGSVVAPARQLRRIRRQGLAQLSDVRPLTPLADAALLTNAPGEPSLGTELRAEIDTSDEVDLLCAFVKWHGLRLLEPELRRLREREAPLRVITTTYMGATEAAALDRLVRELGAEVLIQYDAARTRLHAKAWMFRRRTGFDTAYVGSSNLSRAALLDGVEWNVRLSRVATPTLLDKFRATFDSYWEDPSFESYDPDRDRDRLDDALAEASGRAITNRVTISLSGLEVRPYPYQQAMLDALDVERIVHDRHRNLLVAATGTGKTVVAALDYRGLAGAAGSRPTLLFVAHRREILDQARRAYREVLVDPTFGELYVGGARPERWRHVFATVQSLTSYGIERIPADHFDVVVIDEFHHAEARTYRRIIDHLEPGELLGLTATPERADGTDVRSFFDGRTAAELRLWDALGADLLCPFHYFVVSDGTDLRQIAWSRGRYDDAQLDGLYTGNTERARIILRELRDKVIRPELMRGLGFCVSIAHAEYMAEVFTRAGIPSLAVSGNTPQPLREQALSDLRERRVNVLFAADLFNEGLDLPEVDTVLFLRPTESSTLFLQQLGRGLRRLPGKAVLTALDFVGHHRKEFRFDRKLRALTGITRGDLKDNVEKGFPFLPAGCQIVMDEIAQEVVLENLRGQVGARWPQIVQELRAQGDVTLANFLERSGIELSDVLSKGKRSWTELRQSAGLPTPPGSRTEEGLLKRVRAFAHVDDPVRAHGYQRLLQDETASLDCLAAEDQRLARMLTTSLWPSVRPDEWRHSYSLLRDDRALRDELRQVIDLSFQTSRRLTTGLRSRLFGVPLQVHARYSREEILAALDFPRAADSVREGVAYIPEHNVDVFLSTLKKSDSDFSPTTMYRDFPMSPTLFHWESQNATSTSSPTGLRYLNGTSTVLLFARHEKDGDFGTEPFLFLGPGRYVRHEGEKPIAIVWRLEHALPADFLAESGVVAL